MINVKYTGNLKDFIFLMFSNLFFIVLTVGFYIPRAMTRTRQYISKNILIGDTPLKYTGESWPLFLGMVIFFVLKVVLELFIPSIASFVLIFLMLYGIYAAKRHQWMHLYYKHLSGNLKGSALMYAMLMIGVMLANIFTLGLMSPYFDLKLPAYINKHLSISGIAVQFNPDYKKLNKINLITWALAIPTLFLSRFWYNAYFYNHVLSSTKIADIRFAGTYTGKKFLSVFALSLLLWGALLGLVAFACAAIPLKENLTAEAFMVCALVACGLCVAAVCLYAVQRQLFLNLWVNNVRIYGDLQALPPATESAPPSPEVAEIFCNSFFI